ncbi:galactosylceramide sulfotransferase [Eurytemora carolleeae]|uniref:galactosylceramide sulfotransferase n=1 Tax=Eurytemora carolleeae TaxID=1294199 RepID=UPI000C7602D1|nr:galactosylceramide sulfotransferase [Eurytemora carolleeae]|eukprot:XP_023332442.1 galactosylceramide sulfotransferase-like [Eurytemora affinis]
MRQNVLIKRLTTVFTTFSVFILITFRTNHTEIGEMLLFKDTKEICKPVNKVGFLKIHKCASSSVQNIILRYALKNDLNVVLPSAGNYLGLSTPFSRAMIKGTAWEKAGLEYHMFCLHTVWNQDEVERTLGGRAGVKYLTMIRDPVTTFESAWGYAQMSGFYKMDLETFALSPKTGLLSKNPFKPFGQNQLLHDFGLHPDNFNNSSAVLEKILEIEANFNLVLLAERFQESMILMKNELQVNVIRI